MHYDNCNAEPTIIRGVLRDNLQNNCYCNLDDKPENVKQRCTKKAVTNVPFKKTFPKLKQNSQKVPVSDFSKELFSKFESYRPSILPSWSIKYELLQMFSLLHL